MDLLYERASHFSRDKRFALEEISDPSSVLSVWLVFPSPGPYLLEGLRTQNSASRRAVSPVLAVATHSRVLGASPVFDQK